MWMCERGPGMRRARGGRRQCLSLARLAGSDRPDWRGGGGGGMGRRAFENFRIKPTPNKQSIRVDAACWGPDDDGCDQEGDRPSKGGCRSVSAKRREEESPPPRKYPFSVGPDGPTHLFIGSGDQGSIDATGRLALLLDSHGYVPSWECMRLPVLCFRAALQLERLEEKPRAAHA